MAKLEVDRRDERNIQSQLTTGVTVEQTPCAGMKKVDSGVEEELAS